MKTALYVAMVARTYRKAIDWYLESEECYKEHLDWLRTEIRKCTYRQYSTGFYFGKPDENGQIYDANTYIIEYIYLGQIEAIENGRLRITQKNKFCVGDTIEIMKADGRDVQVQVLEMHNAEGEAVDSCPHAGETIWLTLSEQPEIGDLLRMEGSR